MDYQRRLQKIREHMAEDGTDALSLPSCGDRQYLTGLATERPCITHHHRSGDWLDGLFVTARQTLYTAPWMLRAHIRAQAANSAAIDEIVILEEGKQYRDYVKEVFKRLQLPARAVIGIPKQTMGKTLINLRDVFPQLSFVNIEQYTCPMRMLKDADEIAVMRRASQIADEAFLETLKKIRVGVTEYEIAMELEYQMKARGAECVSFPTDVFCTNPGQPTSGGSQLVKLAAGANVAFDFGCVYNGYCSDTGRTIYIGEPSPLYRRVHELVMAAQQAALNAIRPGRITAFELDCVTRQVINEGGYFEEFFHRLGHNIGVDVHEYPYLNKGYNELLQENMLITVEPSVLIANQLRIRVEDVVLITATGVELLNTVTKDMIVIE